MEILVVLGVFSGVVTISLATLFNMQAINTKFLQSQSILDNVNLSMQTITRDIRYGLYFHCTTSLASTTPTLRKGCSKETGGGTVLYYQPPNATDERDRVVYYVANGILYRADMFYNASTTVYQMTSSDVEITRFKIFAEGVNTSTGEQDIGGAIDYTQPLITIFISGIAKSGNARQAPVPFNIQTHISARILDNS